MNYWHGNVAYGYLYTGQPLQVIAMPHKLTHKQRCGAAIVEMALTLPVFALIVLASIEASSMIFLKQSLEIAAYEGARIAIVPGSSSANVQAGCQQILSARQVVGDSIEVTPNDFDGRAYGTPIRVEVSARCIDNCVISPWFYVNKTISADVTMMKEY